MARSTRRRMQAAVSVIRSLQKDLLDRRADTDLVVGAALRIINASADISHDIVAFDQTTANRIAAAVTEAVTAQGLVPLTLVPTGISEIGDEVTRVICQNQLPVIRRLHIMTAVLAGAEKGLRQLLTATAAGEPDTGRNATRRASDLTSKTPLSADPQSASSPDATLTRSGRSTQAPNVAAGLTAGHSLINDDTEQL